MTDRPDTRPVDPGTDRDLRRMVLLAQRAAPRHTSIQAIDLAMRLSNREPAVDRPEQPRR